MVMIKVNIAEGKAQFSRLIRAARAGEQVIICDHNVPVVEIRPVEPPRRVVVPLGSGDPTFEIPASFFDPLPPEMQHAWEGYDD
jgi:prevent-host-death family protein